jgi:hypothetical protein
MPSARLSATASRRRRSVWRCGELVLVGGYEDMIIAVAMQLAAER